MSEDIKYWSVSSIRKAMVKGDISAVEIAKIFLGNCKKNKELNAFITLDEEGALKRAQEFDNDKSKKNQKLGGIPMGLKDAINCMGLPTSAGTPSFAKANHMPENAVVTQSLIDEGANIFGKLNMHELCYGITSNNGAMGAVRNPYNSKRSPGGSSGGSGASVASGMLPAALGTDTGGSVRIPASFCGIVGFRPSIGRYSQKGLVPVSHTRDTAGPLCRTVEDAALIDAVLTQGDDSLPTLKQSDLRIGIPNHYFFDDIDDDVKAVFEARLDDLRKDNWQLVPVDIDGLQPPEASCGFTIAVYESKGDLQNYLAEHFNGKLSLEDVVEQIVSPDVKGIMSSLLADGFEDMSGPYQEALKNGRPQMQKIISDCFSTNKIDAIIFPTIPVSPPIIGEDETILLNGKECGLFPTVIHNTDPASIAGTPGISIPAGLDKKGLPVGIEIDGPYGNDRHLLAIAHLMQNTLPTMPYPN